MTDPPFKPGDRTVALVRVAEGFHRFFAAPEGITYVYCTGNQTVDGGMFRVLHDCRQKIWPDDMVILECVRPWFGPAYLWKLVEE